MTLRLDSIERAIADIAAGKAVGARETNQRCPLIGSGLLSAPS